MNKILIVDDEKKQRDILDYILKKEGYKTETASSAEEALKIVNSTEIDVVLSDLRLPKRDGLSLMKEVLSLFPDISFIIITGHGSIDSAVSAIKQGAFDYITKPLDRENVITVVKKAFERSSLLKERSFLVSKLNSKESLQGLIGEHPLFKDVIKTVFKVAPFDATVLITGESGTGKELIAKAIHNISPRREMPFLAINCAAIPENLIESELFGFSAGAFTGATTKKRGLFEAANGGTIFLDEVGELPQNTQAKILRVLQDKEILPIGSTKTVKVDVRIIAATNVNLEKKIKDGTFRADLYYRLNIFSIKLPPLRERSSDIPLLMNHFLEKYKYLAGGKVKFFDAESIKLFIDYPWYGNIRELESVVQKAILYSENEIIKKSDVLPLLTDFEGRENPLQDVLNKDKSLDEIEKDLIIRAMEESGWKMSKACKVLGITYRTLQYRLGKYGIKPPQNTPNG
ncbi:MAG: sigma-54 dependent transcriptional regulator [bacterium]